MLCILIGKLDDCRGKSSCSTGMTPQQLLSENSTAFGDCKITNECIFFSDMEFPRRLEDE